jgi:nitroimidazol reductase NimA-like FMN-containing flavoprotein (pyridoxamine 5'-phosphate oxidase superfamily)
MTTDGGHPTSFRELSESRCAELLAAHAVGRVAWQAPDGPQILPVSYAMHDNRIVLRTSPYGPLSQLIRRCAVAFEVDELDLETSTGWSILVRGTAESLAQPTELVGLWTLDGPTPWATGIRNVFIAITARTISGRVIGAEHHGPADNRTAGT